MTHSNVVSYAANEDGLFLQSFWPFGLFMPRLFIPWSEMEVRKKEGVFWNKYEFRFPRIEGVFIRIPQHTGLALLAYAPHNSSLTSL
jgi:hypothetical protein